MKKTILSSTLWIALIGILLAACSGGASADITGEWKLLSFGPVSGPASSPMLAAPDVDTSINFGSDGRLNGNVGCNSFGGGYAVSGAQIKFDSLFSTKMACMGAVDEQERAVLATFAGSVNFKLTGDTLTITSADGSSEVTLVRK